MINLVATDFEKELSNLINRHSMEEHSNTPDFLLANYLVDCLKAYAKLTQNRDRWFGLELNTRVDLNE